MNRKALVVIDIQNDITKHYRAFMRAEPEDAGSLSALVKIIWPETSSLSFHLSIGFQEENRIICFRKAL